MRLGGIFRVDVSRVVRVSVFVGILSLVFGLDFLVVVGATAEFGRVEPLSQSQPSSL